MNASVYPLYYPVKFPSGLRYCKQELSDNGRRFFSDTGYYPQPSLTLERRMVMAEMLTA